jgi:hypothetical protein
MLLSLVASLRSGHSLLGAVVVAAAAAEMAARLLSTRPSVLLLLAVLKPVAITAAAAVVVVMLLSICLWTCALFQTNVAGPLLGHAVVTLAVMTFADSLFAGVVISRERLAVGSS